MSFSWSFWLLKRRKIISELEAINSWFNKRREEFYGLIARKIRGKEKLRDEGYFPFDLGDLERICRLDSRKA
ncbi:MAG: hypothetical protein J7J17_00700 [Hadesarchaea archaeon]|nr:hypothetical protein [Hadesarchaea archaeon]